MSFPPGVETVTLTAGAGGYRALDGTPYTGTLRISPSVSRVVSPEHGVIVLGVENVTLDASGGFSVELLATDAEGFAPTNWTYRVDEEFHGVPGRAFYISLPAATPTVALPSLSPVESSAGTILPGWGSGGSGGGAVSSVNGEIGDVILSAADVGADPSGAAAAAVSAHTGAADPHGDRAAAQSALDAHASDTTAVHGIADTSVLATQSDLAGFATTSALTAHTGATTTVHGIADTAALETKTGAQSKADAAQSTAISTAASDATTKVSNHTSAADPHGDRAYTDTQIATRVPTTRTITAGTGLSGGGDLSANRSLAVSYGTTAGTAAQGNDSRLNDSRAPSGAAGGDLSGTYPNPTVAKVNGVTVSGTAASGKALIATSSTAASWSTVPGSTPAWVFDVTAAAYGAKGDAKVVADGAMASGSATLTSSTAGFTSADVGKSISVKGAAANGVTTLVTTIATFVSSTQVTLANANASGGAVSGAIVIWGTDDTAAIQAAVDAAEAYLTTNTYAQVYFPPRPYIVAGALKNTKSGNGQIVFGPWPVTGNKKILEFRGETDGAAAVRHWQQTVPQFAGSCLISLGVFASTTAQTNSLNANGNTGVICGPTEAFGYGVSATFSNMMPVLKNLAILTTHSSFGLTYGAANFWGCANAHVENFACGTAGVVTGSDYSSPGVFGTGLSAGLLLPAPGNNDNVIAKNVSIGGGYTYAMFLTEHAMVDRYMALYCWAGLVAVGTYAGSVGSVHRMDVLSASIEACTNEVYIMGAGSAGVGPTLYANISTESSTPNVAGNSTAAMNAALGKIVWTGLFTESGVSVQAPTGLEMVNGQVPRAIKHKSASFTVSPIDRTLICNTSGGAITATLPDATFNPVEYCFRNTGANNLVLDPPGTQVINGATTLTLTQNQTVRIQAGYDGTNWNWYSV